MASPHALLLFNPRSRRSARALPDAAERLRREGLQPEIVRADRAGALAARTRAGGEAFDRILMAGGDGTLHRALPDLLAQSRPVAVLPLGTANDFARSVGIPLDLAAACEIAAHGRVRRIDLGEVNGVPFCNVAHIGLGVRAVHGISPRLKRLLGPLEYGRSLLDAMRHRHPFPVRVDVDDGHHPRHFSAIHVAIGNGRYYGAGSVIDPDATIDDGWLDLYSIDPQPLRALLRLGPALRDGRAGRERGVRRLHGTGLRIDTGRSLPIDTDGEIRTRTPASFRVLPGALAVLTGD